MTGDYCELCGGSRDPASDGTLLQYESYHGGLAYLYVCAACEAKHRAVPVAEPSRESVQP